MNTQEQPLSYEDFTQRDPYLTYNNFYFYFLEGVFGEIYREKDHYQIIEQKDPKLVTELRSKIKSVIDSPGDRVHLLKTCDEFLYRAYLIMKTDHVSNDELFS